MTTLTTHVRTAWNRMSHAWRIALIVCVVVIVGVRLALPPGIKWYVNHQLKHAPDYNGHIGGVTVHLWRGAYRIRDIAIFKVTGGVREPLFAAQTLDLSIEWKELFHGAVVGEVVMEKPRLNFVSGPTEAETQTGKEAPWGKILESLFPFKLNRLEIQDGQVHFENDHSTPPVDIYLNEMSAVATNLTNARGLAGELPAGLTVSSRALGQGGLDLKLRLDPVANPPAFELACQVSNVDLVSLNDFLKAYGKFDVARGTFGLYTSVAAKDGNYDGYIKTFFENLDVFNWQKDSDKNFLQIVWQAVVGSVTTIFKNHSQDTLATRIPIAGTYQKSEVGVWSAVATLLRNAFIQALVPKVDEQVTVQQVEKKAEKAEAEKAKAAEAPVPGEKAAQKMVP